MSRGRPGGLCQAIPAAGGPPLGWLLGPVTVCTLHTCVTAPPPSPLPQSLDEAHEAAGRWRPPSTGCVPPAPVPGPFKAVGAAVLAGWLAPGHPAR